MGLAVYTSTIPGAILSQGGSFSNALRATLDGRDGGSLQTLLYVRNDDSLFYYTTIALQPVDTNGVSIVDGTSGYSWKLATGAPQPSEAAWALISDGAAVSMTDLGSAGNPNTSTYLPVWLRIEIPKNAPVKTYTDVVLKITATQTSV